MIRMLDLRDVAVEVSEAAIRKDMSYGSALDIAPKIMRELYPDGILPSQSQFQEFQIISRIVEKLCRLTRGDRNAFNENPWADILGYALHAHKNYVNAGGDNE